MTNETYNKINSSTFDYCFLLNKSASKLNVEPPFISELAQMPKRRRKEVYSGILNDLSKAPLFFYALTKIFIKSVQNSDKDFYYRLKLDIVMWTWEIGEYVETIKFTDDFLSENKLCKKKASDFCYVYRWRGKALRNLGLYADALEAYRAALRVSRRYKIEHEEASCLLMIGKMYGKYEKKENMYLFFIDKALKLFRDRINKPIDDRIMKICNKGLAICYHELAKIYLKFKEYKKSHNSIKKAIRINKNINNENGLSRNHCFLSFIEVKKNKPINDVIKEFLIGYNILKRDHSHLRGIGIRSIQLGKLLCKKNIHSGIPLINDGMRIAKGHNDYRTYLKGILILSEILPLSNDIIKELYEGSLKANEFNLLDLEYIINNKLAKALIDANQNAQIFPSDNEALYDRNKEILEELCEKIIESKEIIQRITNKKTKLMPEFDNLAENELSNIYEGLIYDYDEIVIKLRNSYSSLINAITDSELIKQSNNLLQMSSQVIDSLYHEMKGMDIPPKLNEFIKGMLELCPKSNTMTILSQCINNSISSIEKEYLGGKKNKIKYYKKTDLSLPVPAFFLTLSIISLIRNGLEAYKQLFDTNNISNSAIIIEVSRRQIGDPSVGNPAYVIVFSIANKAKPNDSLRLSKALEKPGFSDKNFNSVGRGIKNALFIFNTVCKASCEVIENDGYTFLNILFKPQGFNINEI